jgi:hypothetical protein
MTAASLILSRFEGAVSTALEVLHMTANFACLEEKQSGELGRLTVRIR